MNMHRPFSIFLFAGLALIGAHPLRAQSTAEEWVPDYELISATGQMLFDTFAPDSIRQTYTIATPEQLQQYFLQIQNGLVGDDLSALADLQPLAQETLAVLSACPQTRPLADWLSTRLDYFEIAAEAQTVLPAPSRPTTPAKPIMPRPSPTSPPATTKPASPAAPQKPNAPATTPATTKPAPVPALAVARDRYAESTQTWIRKLQKRPPPAASAALLPKLKAIFRENKIPEALVWQAEAESSFNPAARSPVGARGLFQFMPATARQYGLRLSPTDERLDPLKSASAAARYLSALHRRFGDWALALAAYNCGEGRVSKLLRKHHATTFAEIHSFLPAETRLYVPKINALLHVREGIDLSGL